MEPRQVATSFLEHDGKILLLRRSQRVRTYPGRWAAVSGSIEPGHTPEQQARQEIAEETGLTDRDVQLVAVGEPLAIEDDLTGTRWVVHPFRFIVLHPERLRLDWEHDEARWIEPAELDRYETVPRLGDTWARVAERADA